MLKAAGAHCVVAPLDPWPLQCQKLTQWRELQLTGCALRLRNLDDVRQLPGLTQQQRMGLEHFDDLQQRIPRSEVAQVGGRLIADSH